MENFWRGRIRPRRAFLLGAMTVHSLRESYLGGRDVRSNGLSPDPPVADQTVLVTGGAGYIGCVLCERLVERGYRVRVLDRLYWGEEPLSAVRDQVELVSADVRDIPATALDGVD